MGAQKLEFGTVIDSAEFLLQECFLEARYHGAYFPEAYKKFMIRCLEACTDYGVRLLLVDITSMSGFRPSTLQRFELGALAASVPTYASRIAVVGTSEQIEPKFACLVARNRGLNVQAFTARNEGLRWLLDGDGLDVR
jgi:hypothetical protein